MPDTAKSTRRRGKNRRIESGPAFLKMSGILLGCALIDQAGKEIVSRYLRHGESVPVLEDVFHLTLVHNPGAVFGFFGGMNTLLIFSSAVFLFLLFFYLPRMERAYPKFYLPAGLIAGGAAGNIADRLRFGYVIDFLDFRVWPVFNFADAAITIGVGLAAWRIWRKR